jgi:hypothetical protein
MAVDARTRASRLDLNDLVHAVHDLVHLGQPGRRAHLVVVGYD